MNVKIREKYINKCKNEYYRKNKKPPIHHKDTSHSLDE